MDRDNENVTDSILNSARLIRQEMSENLGSGDSPLSSAIQGEIVTPLSRQLPDENFNAYFNELQESQITEADVNAYLDKPQNPHIMTEQPNEGTRIKNEDADRKSNVPFPLGYSIDDFNPHGQSHGSITTQGLGQGTPQLTQDDRNPDVNYSQASCDSTTTPRMIAGSELDNSIMHLEMNLDRPNEEESLFVPDELDIDPSQPADSHRLEGDLSLPQIWTEGEDHITVPINGKDVAKKKDATKSKKKKAPGKKTGPRAKTAKEWFAKSFKDQQPPLPEIAGVKRKRSKKDSKAETSRAKKRSKKLKAEKSGKKKSQKKKSMKVMTAIFENLRHSNPIEARIALGDMPQAEQITASTKASQFQQIMQGLPKDADKRGIAADKKRLKQATRSFGLGNCTAKDGKWLVNGMTTSLHAHQVVGASWMLSREFCEEGPWGGILGDEMGMGKTLQALATIVSNRPTDDDLETYSKTTLIVAPATALKQWEEEIRKHTDKKRIGSVVHYKQSKELEPDLLASVGIILASYHDISRQFPSRKLRTELRNDLTSVKEWKEKFDDELGPLFKINFWRVILDEAHQIKNKDSQMSIACQNLGGRHRWGMSGTPITNNLEELYPYLRFLKTDWAGSLQDFQYLYGNTDDNDSASRLSVLMDIIMLRRTMADSFLGRPLYEIPMCHISVRRVQITKEERVIYNTVESRFREIINAILKKFRKQKRKVRLQDLTIYIVFLLRLRQGAAHPFLLEPVLKKTLKISDLQKIQRCLRDASTQTPIFKQIGKWCGKAATTHSITANEQGSNNPQEFFGNSQFGYEFNMDTQVAIAIESQRKDVCRLCYQEPVNALSSDCTHIFCKECLADYIDEERRGGRIIPRCPDCDQSLSGWELFNQLDAEDSDIEDLPSIAGSQRSIARVQVLGQDSFANHPKLKKSQSRFLRECDQAHPQPVVPSAKTIAVKDAILKWQSEAPDDKIIVFMEFKMTGAILGRMLKAEGIKFLYFFGDMTPTAKQNAIRGFHDKRDIKVMIASFRCGSVALNLTCANRVILVDLWWNIAIEMQAFARVFRIGQNKETHFLRIIAQNTIDNRIEALQEEKVENISKALEPGKRVQLSVEEIAALFGHVKKSEDGSFEIVADNEGDAEPTEELEEAEVDEEA